MKTYSLQKSACFSVSVITIKSFLKRQLYRKKHCQHTAVKLKVQTFLKLNRSSRSIYYKRKILLTNKLIAYRHKSLFSFHIFNSLGNRWIIQSTIHECFFFLKNKRSETNKKNVMKYLLSQKTFSALNYQLICGCWIIKVSWDWNWNRNLH